MEFQNLVEKALAVRNLYSEFEAQKYGKPWTNEEIALGFVGDVGDLVKLVMAENGSREISDSKTKLEHELADCMWAIIVLANIHDIDLETTFLETMDELKRNLTK